MKLHLTDEYGRQYEVTIESEESIIDNRTFGDTQRYDRFLSHTLTVTALVGEKYALTNRDTPAQEVIEQLFASAKEAIDEWNNKVS